MEKIWNEFKYFLKTLLCFVAACFLVPVLLILFACVHYSNALVNYILSIKYPELQISRTKKIRSFIDTPRNAGVFNILLQIKGPCEFEVIRKHYEEHLTNAREKAGYLKFPKLRQKLMNCWGHYGWVKDNSSFNLNNHIILNKSNYRGSPVHEGNIQDFVSTLVEKYIPSDLPQWQVIVIPIASNKGPLNLETTDGETGIQEEHYYILLKIHHLIIAEEEDLHISEMLMLQDNSEKNIIEIGGLTKHMSKNKSLSYFVRKPEHIEKLLKYLLRVVINHWNKFIYEFESLETPDGSSGIQITNISQLLSLMLIIAVNVINNYWKNAKAIKRKALRHHKYQTKPEGKFKTISKLLLKEADQRHLSWSTAKEAIHNSLQPANLTKTWARFVWKANVNSALALPYRTYCELMALRDLIVKGETKLASTYCGRLSVFVPLLVYAQMEFLKVCYEIFKAPVNIFEELVQYPSREVNKLHKMSYSGRKIASFSKLIDARELRKRVNFSEEVRESEFVLSCLSGAIRDYFESYTQDVAVPNMLNTTCRTIAKGYFTDNLNDKSDYIGGVVFLQLPLKVPDREHARQIHSIVEQIRRKQIMVYLISMGQTKYDMLTSIFPRVLTKICINYFSSNFPITITEIHGENSDFETTWGQPVEDVLLFRPPQSKTCLSLNIHRFGDKYRLAVMADTQLGPDHLKIVRSFENYMESVTL